MYCGLELLALVQEWFLYPYTILMSKLVHVF